MPTRVNNVKTGSALATPERDTTVAETENLWSSILAAIPAAISVHNASGDITWANQKLSDIYRKSLSELKELSCSQIFHADVANCPHEQVMAQENASPVVHNAILAGRNFSVTIEPLFDQGDKPSGFIRVMLDVTAELAARSQLLKAERFATLGQLLAGVAHDVGTPLNVISGYAEFLLMRKGPADQGHKELTAILDQTRRIAAMLSQALELSRPAQRRADLIDLQILLADSLFLAGHHLRKVDVATGLTCRITKPLIYGEASQLRQAFFNLLLNAGQQIGAGGKLQVAIDEATEMPEFVAISFLGSVAGGAGHDFSRSLAFLGRASDERGEPEETGIGLNLTRAILAEAGARISFMPVTGEGVGLMIYLPVNDARRR